MPVEVRQNVYLIFKEMINNAVKHSKATHIDVRLSKHNNISSMYIKDNGVGLANQQRKPAMASKISSSGPTASMHKSSSSTVTAGIEITGKHIF